MSMKRNVYLDYAAATPVDPKVMSVMQTYFTDDFYNPSALYLASQKVSKDIETARSSVAHQLGAKSEEIIFTAGGTEANNLAIAGVMRQYPGGHMLVSAIEHESVLKPAAQFDTEEVRVRPDGRIDLIDLEKKITKKTVLISVMYANNEIGTIQPIRELAKIVEKVRVERKKQGNTRPLYLHTDACQAANYLDLHVHRLGVDLMTLNGGKIYGPKQSGVLYKAANVNLQPLILGGGQEKGFRSGTESVANVMGFAKALQIAQEMRQSEGQRLEELQRQFINLAEKIAGVTVNGSVDYRLPNNVHITIEGQDNERLLMVLDECGIQCATGSACSASNEEVSHVLHAIGLSDKQAQSSLRFSMGRGTKKDDIVYTVENLQKSLE